MPVCSTRLDLCRNDVYTKINNCLIVVISLAYGERHAVISGSGLPGVVLAVDRLARTIT